MQSRAGNTCTRPGTYGPGMIHFMILNIAHNYQVRMTIIIIIIVTTVIIYTSRRILQDGLARFGRQQVRG